MEHRWGRRVAADADVQIFADPASTGWGRLRDISISGAFIETALEIPALSTLSLTVRAGSLHLVRAIAVRSDSDGIGVEWFDDDAEMIATLMEEVTTWQVPQRRTDEMRL